MSIRESFLFTLILCTLFTCTFLFYENLSYSKGSFPMKNPALFFGGIVLAIIGIALGAYYLIPGISQIAASGTGPHIKHAVALFALAALGIIVTLVNRPKSN